MYEINTSQFELHPLHKVKWGSENIATPTRPGTRNQEQKLAVNLGHEVETGSGINTRFQIAFLKDQSLEIVIYDIIHFLSRFFNLFEGKTEKLEMIFFFSFVVLDQSGLKILFLDV